VSKLNGNTVYRLQSMPVSSSDTGTDSINQLNPVVTKLFIIYITF